MITRRIHGVKTLFSTCGSPKSQRSRCVWSLSPLRRPRFGLVYDEPDGDRRGAQGEFAGRRRRSLLASADTRFPSKPATSWTNLEASNLLDLNSLRVATPGSNTLAQGRKLLGLQPGDGLVHRWSDITVWTDGVYPSRRRQMSCMSPRAQPLRWTSHERMFGSGSWTVHSPYPRMPLTRSSLRRSQLWLTGESCVSGEFATHPKKKTVTFELRGERGSVSIAGAGPRSIVAIDGEVLLRGHAAATEWSTLANVAAVGDEHVDVLTASLDGWGVGEQIIISGTTFGGDASTHETRYISSIHENHGECSQFSVVPCQSYARVNFTDADGKPAPLNFTHAFKNAHKSVETDRCSSRCRETDP